MILLVCGAVWGSQSMDGLAQEILKAADQSDGLCVMVNLSDAQLAVAMARKSKCLIQIIHEDGNTVQAMRKAIDDHNFYGQISVQQAMLERLPYAENLINILLIQDYSSLRQKARTVDEILRVVAPYGVCWLGCSSESEAKDIQSAFKKAGVPQVTLSQSATIWVVASKSYPKTMDEWTHFRHNAEGNMVAQDTVVGPPRHVRWVTGPMFQRHHALTPGTTTMVGSRGRIFYVQDESPIGFAGLPDQWRLVARDAFNGKLLWKRDMGHWGDSAWSWWSGGHGARANHPYHINKRLVASKDRVFVTLGYNAPVSALDPATGETLLQYDGTQYADEMVYRNGILYVSVNDRPQKPLPGRGFSVKPTADNDSQKMIWAIEPVTGKVFWKAGPYTGVSDKFDRLRSMKQVLLVASDEGVFVTADKGTVVGLDLDSGKERFQTSVKVSGKTSTMYHQGMLLIADKGTLTAIGTDTGEIKWQNNIGSVATIEVPEVLAIEDLVWVGDAKRMVIWALDIATGKEIKSISIEKVIANAGHHHRCYPNKGTVNYFISGRRGAEFTAYESGQITLNHWARGQCRYGLMPANGLLYKLPDPCTCHLAAKLLGFYALASQETTEGFFHDQRPQHPLQKGPAFDESQIANRKSKMEDWPAFRHDAMRSSSVKTTIADKLKTLWNVELGTKLTPPVIASGRVVVSTEDEHKVCALDAKDGQKLWTSIVGGRVDSPPTIYRSMVLFGSADGWVTCLRATDAKLIWRFRAAPYDRNIMAYDQIESAWPVHGSVTVANGVVYCSAGRSSFVDGGIYLFALDTATGRVLGKNVIHDVQEHNRTIDNAPKDMPEHAPGAGSNILTTDGIKLYSRYREFDFGVSLQAGKDDYLFPTNGILNPQSSFFDQFWFHRLSWTYGRIQGNMIAFDEDATYSVFMYKRPGSGQHKLYVPLGGDVSMIPDKRKVSEEDTGIKHMAEVEEGGFVLQKGGAKATWKTTTFPVCPLAMVVTEKKLLVAGFMDAIDPKDPWANIEGRKNSVLWILSKQDGTILERHNLETLPVWNGMAAANGKVFISLKNGKLVCMGE